MPSTYGFGGSEYNDDESSEPFDAQARDSPGNGRWKMKNDDLEHGDLICDFAIHHTAKERPDGLVLTLRKSRTHKDAWTLINSGMALGEIDSPGDMYLGQLRENYKCFGFARTAIGLTIV